MSASDAGQAIAEFGIAAIPLLLLLLGILQFAFIYNAQVGLTNGVRDAARYGSTLIANDNGTATTAADRTYGFLATSLGKYVAPFSPSRLVSGSGQSEVCYEQRDDGTNSDPDPVWVKVRATYDHPLLVPIINLIIDAFDGASDGSFRITTEVELRVSNPAEPAPNVTIVPCDFS